MIICFSEESPALLAHLLHEVIDELLEQTASINPRFLVTIIQIKEQTYMQP
jgi:hypothetical protein